MRRLTILAATLLITCIVCAQTISAPKSGYVPNEKTAIRVAEAVLAGMYGEKYVQTYKPFHATLHEGVWQIHATVPRGITGGGFGMEISQTSGAILRLVEFQ